ncbi:MAG: hypothetical protein SVR81_04280, partial [Chloroflexota bacterium]|nr:hypothetical protein [Chloroflexota bacterium]
KGHKVDVLELAPVFVEKLQAAAEPGLPVEVIEGDILDPLVLISIMFFNSSPKIHLGTKRM